MNIIEKIIKFLDNIGNKKKYLYFVTIILFVLINFFIVYNLWIYNKEQADNNAILAGELIQAALNRQVFYEFSGTEADSELPQYQGLKEKLIQLADSDDNIRSAYIFIMRQEKLFFVIDSERMASSLLSLPGEEFSGATDEYFLPYERGNTTITSITTNKWGNIISILVPIKDNANEVVAVFALDYDATSFYNNAIINTIVMGIAALSILILIFAIFLINLKNHRIKISEKHHQELIKQMQQGFALHEIIYDKNGNAIDYRYISVNKSFEKMTGLKGSDIIGKTVLEILPQTEDYWIKTYANVVLTKESVQMENYSREIGKYFRVSAYPIYDRQFVVIIEDVSERKQFEKEINKSMQRFMALFEHMTSGAAIYKVLNDGKSGRDYIIQDFNKKSLEIENKEKSEVIGKSLYDIRPNIDNYGLIDVFRKVWETGISSNYPAKMYIDDVYYNYYENHIFKLPSGEIVAIYDDVTEIIKTNEKIVESERKYRQITENISDVVWTTDLELNTTYVSGSVKKLLGYEVDEYKKIKNEEKYPVKELEKIKSMMIEELSREKDLKQDNNVSKIVEVRHYNKSGNLVDLSMNVSFVRDDDGNITGLQGVTRDISERKKIEKELIYSNQRFDELAKQSKKIIWEVNAEGIYTYISDVLKDVSGYEPNEIIGKIHFYDKHIVEGREEFKKKALKIFERKEAFTDLINPAMAKNGNTVWIRTNGIPILDERGKLLGYKGSDVDVTEKVEAEKRLIEMAYHDQLTGLHNRRYYEEELKKVDNKHNYPLALALIDINGLKMTNDAFGHKAGDKLLQKIAEILLSIKEENQIISRIGGDEFIYVMPNSNKEKTIKSLNNIKDLVKKEKANSSLLSISIGYSIKENESDDISKVFKAAEDDLYRHKLSESASMRSKTIDIIMNSLIAKNKREMLHSSRVSLITENLARAMDFNSEDIKMMRLAGLMHDIGKIGIADNVLNKEGKLNDDEMKDIKRHSEIGYRILSSSNEFSEISEYVLAHHERWDGKGYPKGLKGEEIPLEARIIAVADAYDAMTSERSYKKAMTKEEAIEEITLCSGKQFDSHIVKVFIEKVADKIK